MRAFADADLAAAYINEFAAVTLLVDVYTARRERGWISFPVHFHEWPNRPILQDITQNLTQAFGRPLNLKSSMNNVCLVWPLRGGRRIKIYQAASVTSYFQVFLEDDNEVEFDI